MIEKIQHATASLPERKGACKGRSGLCVPEHGVHAAHGLLYLLVKDLLAGSTSGEAPFICWDALPALH